MKPWFIATEKFDKTDSGWDKYIDWSGLKQLDEVVSVGSLCGTVLPDIKSDYWGHIVNEDYMLNFFVDEEYLRGLVSHIQRKNFLCVFRNPEFHPSEKIPKGFDFVGYDFVDKDADISALTNCGGFPDAFSNDELSVKGLLTSFDRAKQAQADLRRLHPEDFHADCDLWAIFRSTELSA